eukprot:2459821-Rhodomonas_salina.1
MPTGAAASSSHHKTQDTGSRISRSWQLYYSLSGTGTATRRLLAGKKEFPPLGRNSRARACSPVEAATLVVPGTTGTSGST